VSNILALGRRILRGGPGQLHQGRTTPSSTPSDLVASSSSGFNSSGGHGDPTGFGIGVAGFPEGHPSTPNRLMEMDYLKAKVDAGADLHLHPVVFSTTMTSMIFREPLPAGRASGWPIIAGIMPINQRRAA